MSLPFQKIDFYVLQNNPTVRLSLSAQNRGGKRYKQQGMHWTEQLIGSSLVAGCHKEKAKNLDEAKRKCLLISLLNVNYSPVRVCD